MELFKGQNLIEFSERFKTDEDCKEYLANTKWNAGFNCVKCDHSASQIRKNFSRTCNRCSHRETASAITLFHKVNFGLRKAVLSVLKCQRPLKVYLHVILEFALGLQKRLLVCSYTRLEKR